MFKVPEKNRVKDGPLGSDYSYGDNGYFIIPSIDNSICHPSFFHVIASDGECWEHLSAHIRVNGEDRTPTWEEMCFIKGIFWDDEDVVMQLHPKKSEYVNNHPHVLHLWRPIGVEIPTPPSILVGVK